MASVTKTSNEKDMADEEPRDIAKLPADKGGGKLPSISYASNQGGSGPSYFTLYKRGQGYWTRMGTVGGAIMIGGFTAYNIYAETPTFLPNSITHSTALKIAAILVAVFAIAYSWLAWHVMNKPANADFLIATDSEMKKVNWTTRVELIGSTKIVIIFMFLVAIFLFAVDQIFGWLMYLIHVLKVSPLG